MIKTYIKQLSAILILVLFSSCEIDKLEVNSDTEDGGGTLTSYIAYSINSTDPSGSNVYGRIVFWKNSLNQTLAQVSLYNTVPGLLHPTLVLAGDVGTNVTTMVDMGTVTGNTGELTTSKFYVISDTSFYNSILTMNSHINIYLSPTNNTIVATGGLGINADPVAQN